MAYANPSKATVPWPEDNWVERNEEMWIHGRTNFETPPVLLDKLGFYTPNDMFFVRQHSAVPRALEAGQNQDDHTFFVEQVVHDAAKNKEVKKTMSFSIRDLKSQFEVVELASMLCCSGQRRYEYNLHEQTGGAISWHNSTGNAKWTGVLLRDVLLKSGIDTSAKIAKFCEFQGKEGYKGCVPFHKCIDPNGDVLIAFEMNGEPLPPDHGYPLRILIPGYSAKCSTKWLTGISVRDVDCDFGKHKSYYKLLPTSMKPGTEEYVQFHQDPQYQISELNVNSVIFEPHAQTRAKKGPLKVSGYACTGGGRTLARIELSMDGGLTWTQVRNWQQKLTEGGKLWTWARWEYEVKDFDPATPGIEICCRAWDSGANTQPTEPIWNYTGMLNNSLHRVRIMNTADGLLFAHPTQWKDPSWKYEEAEAPKDMPAGGRKKALPVMASEAGSEMFIGAWSLGKFMDATVNLVAQDGVVVSKEARWGNEKLHGDVITGNAGELGMRTKICGFEVSGYLFDCGNAKEIRFVNGMLWKSVKSFAPAAAPVQPSAPAPAGTTMAVPAVEMVTAPAAAVTVPAAAPAKATAAVSVAAPSPAVAAASVPESAAAVPTVEAVSVPGDVQTLAQTL